MSDWNDEEFEMPEIQMEEVPGMLRTIAGFRTLNATEANACGMAAEALETHKRVMAVKNTTVVICVAALVFALMSQAFMGLALWTLLQDDATRALRIELAIDPKPKAFDAGWMWIHPAQPRQLERGH